jgi:amidase
MTGAEPGDQIPSPPPAGPLSDAASHKLRPLRIAVSFKPVLPVPVSDDVRHPVAGTADLLRSLGHEVVERDPVYPPQAVAAYLALLMHGFAQEVERLPAPERLERRMRAEWRTSRMIPGRLARWALAARPRLTDRNLRLFAEADILMTPVTAKPPVTVGHWEGLGPARSMLRMITFAPFTEAQNFTGQPAISIPAGFAADGMPQAVQLISRPEGEETLISLAAQLETARPWSHIHPPAETGERSLPSAPVM